MIHQRRLFALKEHGNSFEVYLPAPGFYKNSENALAGKSVCHVYSSNGFVKFGVPLK